MFLMRVTCFAVRFSVPKCTKNANQVLPLLNFQLASLLNPIWATEENMIKIHQRSCKWLLSVKPFPTQRYTSEAILDFLRAQIWSRETNFYNARGVTPWRMIVYCLDQLHLFNTLLPVFVSRNYAVVRLNAFIHVFSTVIPTKWNQGLIDSPSTPGLNCNCTCYWREI